jgi:hypothetical protein
MSTFGISLFRNHVRPVPRRRHYGDAAEIVHRFQRLDDVAEFADGAAAVPGLVPACDGTPLMNLKRALAPR